MTLEVPKTLGQSNPAATTLTDLYAVPSGFTVKKPQIIVANRSATPTAFRLSVAIAGVADGLTQYIAYDTPIAANDVVNFDSVVSLGSKDVVRVYATLATLTFSIFGEELS